MHPYLKILFSLMLTAYLVIALTMTAHEKDDRMCRGVDIVVTDDGSESRFVTSSELAKEIDDLPSHAHDTPLTSINTQELRRRLLALDKIEDAEVVRLTDGSIRITAQPIIPAARIFDGGESYYINRAGKRVSADARYHKDVPVIQGHFDPADSVFTPQSLLPLINHIASDSTWNGYVSMIKVKSPSDIILVPIIREHVINIGSPTHLDDKFERLQRFYSEVLPKQGWEKYDTLSLKWKGQLVATKRKRNSAPVQLMKYDDDETVDTGTMLAGDDVAPGQTVPGMEAHSEKPIPKQIAN